VVNYSTVVPDLDLRMPNIMTPNGDPKNERLRPFDPLEEVKLPDGRKVFDYFEVYQLKVYDRWGVQVFESNGPESWDGTFDSKEVEDGVYYYILNYRLACSGIDKKMAGHVEVMRQK
jgi:gliding motility-associated-like protein